MAADSFTHSEIRRLFPDLDVRKASLALIDDGIYKREEDHWRRLDDRVYESTRQMTGGEGDGPA
jgi:hypothetical protein